MINSQIWCYFWSCYVIFDSIRFCPFLYLTILLNFRCNSSAYSSSVKMQTYIISASDLSCLKFQPVCLYSFYMWFYNYIKRNRFPTLRKKFWLKFQMSLPKIIKPFVQVQICPKLPPHKGYNQKSREWTSTDTSWTFQVIWFDYFRTLPAG